MSLRRLLLAAVVALLAVGRGLAAPPATYRNPILFADYSDPDVIRVGNDFYLIASSFHFVPAIPILHSTDLVHWEIVGHVVPRLTMSPAYDMAQETRYGGGVWAPSVRFHKGLFYIYFPTPGEGIFVSTASSMRGPWSAPVVVLAGHGYEDPCPFWDDDGNAYLVHSVLGAGPLILHRMSPDGKHLLDAGKVIVEDRVHLRTLEGPKLYKRNGWYYIFAPFGGVAEGSQAVLRSRHIDGPYDDRVVLAQGSTDVNGPHQGGWVDDTSGNAWFVHFQQRGWHGRIVWLEPMAWQDDWPLMGTAVATRSDPGEPVLTYRAPAHRKLSPDIRPRTSDEFSALTLAPLWEWNHNPDNSRWSLTERRGFLRLHPGVADSLLHARNTLTEMLQDEAAEITVRLDTTHLADGDRAGLSAFDRSLTSIGVVREGARRSLFFSNSTTMETTGPTVHASVVLLRVRMKATTATYSYSVDQGRSFEALGTPVKLQFSWWKGARPALFAFNTKGVSQGSADFDWVHYKALP